VVVVVVVVLVVVVVVVVLVVVAAARTVSVATEMLTVSDVEAACYSILEKQNAERLTITGKKV